MIYPNPYQVTSTLINYIATASTSSNLYARSFGTGEDSEQAVTGSDLYPRVFLEQPFNIDKQANLFKWNLAINITDLITHDLSGRTAAMDLCLGIGNAIINKITEDKFYSIDPNINYLELDQYNDDLTTGWRIEFTLIQPFPFNRCDVVDLSGGTYINGTIRDFYYTNIQDGINTYTGGTSQFPTVNITGGTFIEGYWNSLSATTFYSGSTPLQTILDNLGGGGSGESNTASNLGSGTGVFYNKSGVDLQFRSFTGGTGIVVSTGGTSGETIFISSVPNSDSAILVLCSSTANISGTYNNNTTGVGAVLSGSSNGTLANQDGIAPGVGELVLLRNQTSAIQNGIFSVTSRGGASSRWVLTRYSLSDETEEFDPQLVFVTSGSTLKGNYYSQTTASPEVGTDNIVYDLLGTGSATLYVTQLASGTQVNGQIPYWTGTARQLHRSNSNFVRHATSGNIGIFVSGSTPNPMSRLDVAGSAGVGAITALTSNHTLTIHDYMILGDATTGSKTFTLPNANTCNRREYVIKKIDSSSNTVTLSGGTNTIDGMSSIVISGQNEVVWVKSNGINYYRKVSDNNQFFESGSTGIMSVQLKNLNNTTTNNYSFTLGKDNINTTQFGLMLGGRNNNSTLSPYTYGGYTTILNGLYNFSCNNHSFIGGGVSNIISGVGYSSSIVNGGNNKIYSPYSTIVGGVNNTISNQKSAIAGGENNTITGSHSFIMGASSSVVGNYSSILGGASNSILGNHSSIAGGLNNGITGRTSAILSGRWNQVVPPGGHIVGGYNNTITSTGAYSSILGGRYNIMRGNYSSIIAGRRNEIGFQAHRNVILCGIYNVINSGLTNTSILAGNNITALSSNTAYSKGIVAIDLTANTTSNSQVNVTPEGRLTRGNFLIKSSGITFSSFTDSPLQYQVVFDNNYSNTNYAIQICSEDSRVWSFDNRTISGFTINSNSASALTGITTWIAVPYQS